MLIKTAAVMVHSKSFAKRTVYKKEPKYIKKMTSGKTIKPDDRDIPPRHTSC